MIEVVTEITIRASIEKCFDYARDIDVHTQTVWKHTHERAVSGVTSGKIDAGDTVTFQATHFGIRQKLTSRIVQYERPHVFVDQMVSGAFQSMRHEHHFSKIDDQTTCMKDMLKFEAPYGVLGRLAERLVLKNYMHAFIQSRNMNLKAILEQKNE
ncbi:SRPBCC family protein [Paenibacillus sp. ACRRY]|nr:SRPBCC family protein [Paenibacillus sp. ACRRY]MCG7382269.1 SRPBCC family protein [Paenibacillus sp. ACRRY]